MHVLGAHPWLLVVVPAAMAAVGFASTRLAIWALLRPLSYVGVRPFGWQGVIPAKAGRIAPPLVGRLLDRVGTIRDVYRAMDPDRIAEHIVMSLRPRMAEVVEDAVLDVDPSLWDELTKDDRRRIVASVERDLPELAGKLIADIDADLDQLVDLDYLVRKRLVDDRAMLTKLFGAVGRYSFTFLANVGLLSGLGAGLAMVGGYLLMPYWWLPPVVGLLAMTLASAVSLRAVFGMSAPRRIGRWHVQGVLYRDQDRGSRIGVRIFTRDVITVGNFVRDALEGARGDRVRALIAGHVGPMIHRALEPAMPTLRRSRSEGEIARIEEALHDAAIDVALTPLEDRAFNRERQVVLEDVFLNRMLDLTPGEYESLVRPSVRDSEWLYVLVAAVAATLGGLIVGALFGALR